MGTSRKITGLVLGLAAVCAFALIGAGSAMATKPTEETSGACPSSSAASIKDPKVAASYSNAGTTTTYKFTSLENEPETSPGVPGLVGYCVYPEPSALAKGAKVTAEVEVKGVKWLATKSNKSIGFVRPGGNETNIRLDKKTVTMGTATWTELPNDPQTILLHVADKGVCGTSGPTCFVVPTGKAGPICNAGNGNTLAAYNSMPFDVVNCGAGGYGFEAQSSGEFGDEVELNLSNGTTLKSMTVDFQSYACETSGHWNKGVTEPCVTKNNGTFTVPITARIYDTSGNLLATSGPTNYNIKFRPSADATNCPGGETAEREANSRWLNTVSGKCQNSIAQLVKFDSWTGTSLTLPSKVIWTVAFNTTHHGQSPIGESALCFTSGPGCPYDSLNVGEGSFFVGAPYAGKDVSEAGYWTNHTEGTFGPPNLEEEEGNAERPLGEIVTQP